MEETPANSFPYPEKLNLLMKAIQELLLLDQAGKKKFRTEAAPELQTGKGSFTFTECYSMLRQIGGGEQLLASLEAGRSLMLDGALVYIKKHDVLNPEFEFSEDTEQFESEFTVLLIIFYNSVKAIRDPSSGRIIYPEFSREDNGKFDLAVMKALFQAGKVIERLKHKGKKTSDIPTKISREQKKNRYSDQEIIEAFHKCEGKNLHAMALEIEAFIADHKKENKTKRDVPSISTIKRALKDNGLDKELKK